MDPLTRRAIALCREDSGVLVLDDADLGLLADDWAREAEAGRAFEGAEALLAAALALLEEPRGKPAGRTLLALVLAAQPALVQLDAARAARLGDAAHQAQTAFAAFVDDGKGPRTALHTDARPPGTTPAGPLSRFALLGQTLPGNPPKKGPP